MGQPAAAAATSAVHGLAPALTSFVGRAAAVGEVAGLLSEHRLVTVTGPGGSGKTRLAVEVAGSMADQFADGAWLAELASVRDPAQVPAVVAAALGIPQQPGLPAAEALARVLGSQQLLLVLDNCEHVISAAAALCARLLSAADDVRVLATSREPLRIAGEARHRLAPLTLPDPDETPGDVARSEAVALFADRARRADLRFTIDDQSGSAVGRLVTRLDGMPLAIELAAARVEALGVSQLLELLDDRFDLLTTGDRLAAGRQRSLAATIDWSYQLLDKGEQRVFRAVSVFPGPFTLKGAEAVAGDGAGASVLHLVDCSLLSPPRAGPDGRSRYVMLETLRAYGSRLLAGAGEHAGAAAALARYALGLAEEAATGLATGTGELAAARWLDAEDATTRQALAWALNHDAPVALRLAVGLAPWWYLRGRGPGGYPLLRQAAGHAAPGSEEWCAAQFWLGRLASYSADLGVALGHYTAVVDVAGDRPSPVLADCLASRPLTLANLGRLAEAAEDGRFAVALAREFGYPAAEARALSGLTAAANYVGDFDGALRHIRQAGQITADIPGWIARECGHVLAEALTGAGDLAAAESVCIAGLARARDAGDLRSQALLLYRTTELDLRTGRTGDAAAHLREELQIAMRVGDRVGLLNALEACGYLCAVTGRSAEAVATWAAYAALSRQWEFTDPPAEARRRAEPLRQARQALGDARAAGAEDRGGAMSLATAAEYVLMLTASGPEATTPRGLAGLSARERELLTLVAQGLTDAQIAAQLFISARTVGSHLDRIRRKTGCRRRADLTRLALTAGLV